MFGMVKELFPCIAFEAVGDINPMGIEANQLISSITRDDSLTPSTSSSEVTSIY